MSKTLLVASALLTTLSFSAYSQSTSSVCDNPLQRICDDTVIQKLQRKVYVDKLKSEISQEASSKSAPRIEDMKKKIPKFRLIKRAIEAYKIRNQEIMNAARKRVVGLEEVVTSKENVSLLKDYMYQAIDDTRFDPATKATMKSNIKSIVVGNFGDFIERTNLDDNFLVQLLGNHCGSDGMVSNAFATTLNNEKYVLICPGFLITLAQTADLNERFDSILLVISHEMGHHIDNGTLGNEIYKPFLSCIANNYHDSLKQTAKDQKFCKKNEKDPAACKMKVAISHGGELVSDVWGLKVLNIHARSKNYSFIETDTMLTNSWTNLCGTQDQGIHPSGDFRIGTMLRTQPEITEYLGCDNRSVNSKPACTFDGEISI